MFRDCWDSVSHFTYLQIIFRSAKSSAKNGIPFIIDFATTVRTKSHLTQDALYTHVHDFFGESTMSFCACKCPSCVCPKLIQISFFSAGKSHHPKRGHFVKFIPNCSSSCATTQHDLSWIWNTKKNESKPVLLLHNQSLSHSDAH
jgi:hypothetical protein